MLPVLYEFPEEIVDDRSNPPAWQDPKNWWMVTPNRDRSVSIARLEEDWEKAKLKGQGGGRPLGLSAPQHRDRPSSAVRSMGRCRLLGAGSRQAPDIG